MPCFSRRFAKCRYLIKVDTSQVPVQVHSSDLHVLQKPSRLQRLSASFVPWALKLRPGTRVQWTRFFYEFGHLQEETLQGSILQSIESF